MSISNPRIHYANEIQKPLQSKGSIKKLPWKTIGIYALAFFIPIIVMSVVYICIGIFPFGEKSLLTIDLYHQYIDFFSHYRQSLMSFQPQNLLYSFSKSLGGNTLGLYAYYLASPFNLVFLLFRRETLSEAILAITLLKIGTCGITFTVMCRKMFNLKTISTLVFSTCYALMAYNIVFQQNIMWLDGVIWLPIIALGIYNIINKNSFVLYSISLCIALLSNYYIGYMLCIFSVLFFGYLIIVGPERLLTNRQKWRRTLKFILASLLAGGLAAFLLVPTFMSLQNGKASFDSSLFTLNSNFDFTKLLQKLFVGEMDIELLHQGLETTLPDIFSGTVTTLLCFLYFFNKKITIKEKGAAIAMLLILIMSFHIKAFDLIWHGFNTPVGFLYRNAFIFSFFAIFMGVRCFINIDGITRGNLLASIGLFVAVAILVNNFSLESLTAFEIYITIILFMLYALILGLMLTRKKSALLFLSLILIIVAEFEISGFLTLEDLSHVSRETHVNNITSTDKALSRLQKMDNGIYRIDKNYMRSRNDGMMHGYKTITHSSSTADFKVVGFLNKMGYRNESNIGNSYDYGSTLPADSLMGIKYVLSNTNDEFNYYVNSGHSDNIKIYQNPYALPFMFKASENVLNVTDSYNIFETQNSLYSSMSGQRDVLKQIANVQVDLENLTKTSSGKNVNYSKNIESDPGHIEFTFTAINNEEIYAHFPTEPISESTVDVYVNGIKIRQHLDSDHLTYYDVLRLGQFNAGDTVRLKLVLKENETNFENFFIYALDKTNFDKAYSTLSNGAVNFEMKSQNHIVANIDGAKEDEVIFTTIPYDKGWAVTIDEKKAEVSKVMDTLMAIKIEPGSHKIELKYTPPGFNIGLLISCASILILIITAILFDSTARFKKHIRNGVKDTL